jgi:phosphoribosyl-ATP pyrophosphohydrolase
MVEVTVHTQQDTEAVVVSSVEEMVEVVSPAEMVDAEEVVEEMEAAAAAAAAVVRRQNGVIWDWRFLVYHLGIW